jgi:hypothetical protein
MGAQLMQHAILALPYIPADVSINFRDSWHARLWIDDAQLEDFSETRPDRAAMGSISRTAARRFDGALRERKLEKILHRG